MRPDCLEYEGLTGVPPRRRDRASAVGAAGGCQRPHGLFTATHALSGVASPCKMLGGFGGVLVFLSVGAAGEGRAVGATATHVLHGVADPRDGAPGIQVFRGPLVRKRLRGEVIVLLALTVAAGGETSGRGVGALTTGWSVVSLAEAVGTRCGSWDPSHDEV